MRIKDPGDAVRIRLEISPHRAGTEAYGRDRRGWAAHDRPPGRTDSTGRSRTRS